MNAYVRRMPASEAGVWLGLLQGSRCLCLVFRWTVEMSHVTVPSVGLGLGEAQAEVQHGVSAGQGEQHRPLCRWGHGSGSRTAERDAP